MDFLFGYWYFFFNLWTWFQILLSKHITPRTCVHLTFTLPKQFIFSPPLQFHCCSFFTLICEWCLFFIVAGEDPGAWKTGKYWILFYPICTWSNCFHFHCWETLRLGRLAAICSSWSLLTVSVSGNHLLCLGNMVWFLQFLMRKYSFFQW